MLVPKKSKKYILIYFLNMPNALDQDKSMSNCTVRPYQGDYLETRGAGAITGVYSEMTDKQ